MRTRAEQIDAIQADQQLWRDLAAEVGPGRYGEPGPMGEWSFGDMAGHLLGWRNRTIARLQAFSRGEPDPPDPWPAELDDDDLINLWIRSQHADRTPPQLVADYGASYDRLISIIESMPEAKLTDPNLIPWLEVPLVEVDFTDHLHDEHLQSVRTWLDG
jgi:DinB family protein